MALSITFKRWRCLQFTSKMALFTVYFKDGAAYSGTEKMARLIVALKIRCCLVLTVALKRWRCLQFTEKMELFTVYFKDGAAYSGIEKIALFTVYFKDGGAYSLLKRWR